MYYVWRDYRYIYIRWCFWNKNGSFLNEGMIFILLRAFLEHWQNRDRTARKGSLAFCISLSVISLQKLTIVMFNLQFSSKKKLISTSKPPLLHHVIITWIRMTINLISYFVHTDCEPPKIMIHSMITWFWWILVKS